MSPVERCVASRNEVGVEVRDVAVGVGAAGSVHPSRAVVGALIDEELSPRHSAIGVQAFLTRKLNFGAEEKGRVRIDEKERVVRESVGGCDGNAVGALVGRAGGGKR